MDRVFFLAKVSVRSILESPTGILVVSYVAFFVWLIDFSNKRINV